MSIAVVGAGVVGRLLAWRLARRGAAVTLYDRGDWTSRTACSFAAAGLLTPAAESARGGDRELCEVGFAALQDWAELLASLPTAAAPVTPVTLGRTGTLAVARGGELADLREYQARVERHLPGVRVHQLNGAQLVELEPALAGCGYTAALHLPDEGYIQSRAALTALGEALAAHPRVACRLKTEVLAVEPGGVVTAAGRAAHSAVADCRGLGAQADLPDLRGVRGELIDVHAPEVKLTRPLRVLHQRYPVYIAPRGDDLYAVGATCLESESLAPVTAQAALELLGAAVSAHPGFRYATIAGLVANCRPAFPDHRPRVAFAQPGLLRVNGLYRHGFLLAPSVTAEAERRLLEAL